MLAGDGVVLWMGHGFYAKWGIIGFGAVDQIVPDLQCTLTLLPGTKPITPYPKNQPAPTSETEFLRDVFSIHYRPLRDLFVKLGCTDIKRCVATIDEMTSTQFMTLLGRAQELQQGKPRGPGNRRLEADHPVPQRDEVTTYRIVRNSQLSRSIKELHNHRCQICGTAIKLHNGELYSEAHHIKPLGTPHNGPDSLENLLVVCPNHHVMCDYGTIKLDLNELQLHPEHGICNSYIDYYNTVVYRPPECCRTIA